MAAIRGKRSRWGRSGCGSSSRGSSRRARSPCSSSTFRAGARVSAAHSHDGYEETIYGLGGPELDGRGHAEGRRAGRGARHPPRCGASLREHGRVDATALAIVTPGILGPDYFRDVAAVLEAATDGPPDLAAIGEVMRRHGLTPA